MIPITLNSKACRVEAFILHAQDDHGVLTTREREDDLTPSREEARTRRIAKIERGMVPRLASFKTQFNRMKGIERVGSRQQNQRNAFQPNSSLRPSTFAPLR